MKRPLALTGFTFFLAILLSADFDLLLTLLVTGLLILSAGALLFFRPAEEKYKRFRSALLAVLLTAGIGCCVSYASRAGHR